MVRRLRESGLQMHAIVISAYTDEMTIGEAANAGAAFFAKPVDLEALARMIGDLESPG